MKKSLELYIHIPFCIKKCEYCDFLSAPQTKEVREAYVKALITEIRAAAAEYTTNGIPVSEEYLVTSIFLGGGTPSVLEGEQIGRILDMCRNCFVFADQVETTIEANPGTVDSHKLKCYLDAGINRISFGCQSADEKELKILGRIHTWQEFLDNYQLAKQVGFHNINVDLMSGLPGQTMERWESSLRKVASCNPQHISAYSLIVEEGTPFYEKQLELPDEETERMMYERTWEILKEYGYEQYEISNYAKPGYECRHNIGYWDGTEYLGLGLGSASLMANRRFSNTRDLTEYLQKSSRPDEIRELSETLSVQDRMDEFMILGMRMTQGVSENVFFARFGMKMMDIYGPVIEKYKKMGFLSHKNGHVSFTREGISVSNPILADFLTV